MKSESLFFGSGPFDKMTRWAPESPALGTVFVLHGLTEYIGRYEELARFMTERGWAVAGFDIPGHGNALLTAEGLPRRGYCGGEGSWQDICDMLGRALNRIKTDAPDQPLALLGFSLGSFLARAWLIRQADPLPVDRLLLLGTGEQNPMVLRGVRSVIRRECRRHGEYNSSPLVQSIAFGSYNRRIKNAVSPYAWLLSDPEALASYEKDPLICRDITGGLFRELLSCMIYVSQNEKSRTCPVPVAFLSGDEDPVGEGGKGVRRAAVKFPGAPVILVPGRHDILHDAGREAVFRQLAELLA